jgi:hypothetical protein
MIYDMEVAREARTAYIARNGSLKTVRSSWDPHYAELGRNIMPRNVMFQGSDRNRGGAHHYNRIYDNTGVRSNRTLGAGMQAGITNPGRPWFKLVPADPDLGDFFPVRRYLDDVVDRMQKVFSRSNTYRTLHMMYEELGAFGTAVSIVRPDVSSTIHHYPVTLGRYCLQQNWRGEITTLYREISKTVGEVVKEFGIEACSSAVRDLWRARNFEATVDLLHVIEPRADELRDPSMPGPQNMPFKSVYMELASDDERLLRVSGFERFPVLAPRWAIAGANVYGHSPGMEALGDIKQLQHEQLMKGRAISYKVQPPLQVPTSLKDRESEMFAGGISYYEPGMLLPYDQVTPAGGIRTAFEVNLELDHILADIQDCRQRIQASNYSDLFLMLSTIGPDQRMTATEVAERHEEKLIALGPVLERLHNELLQPLIDLTYAEMQAQGKLPPPPPELIDSDLGVEFTSILAQAQRQIGTADIDRFMGNVVALQPVFPQITDKVNIDKWVDVYSKMRGVPNDLVNPDEVAIDQRKARAQAQAAQQQTEMMAQSAKAMRDLSQSPVGTGSALDLLPSPTEEQTAI